jgi:hypothetical protein
MADTKISALTAVSAVANTQEFVVNDGGTSKKANGAQIADFLETIGLPRVKALSSDHYISSTTGTEVTGLQQTLETGTFVFDYYLNCRGLVAANGISLGVNFTGTAANKVMAMTYVSNSTAGVAGQQEDNRQVHGSSDNQFSTTAPTMQSNGGWINVTTIANTFFNVKGLLVVTAGGDLELWHASEGAANTGVLAGSSSVVIRTA